MAESFTEKLQILVEFREVSHIAPFEGACLKRRTMSIFMTQ